MELRQYPLEFCGNDRNDMARQIVELERTAWPGNGGEGTFPSAPGTYAASFVWMDGTKAVCHVGIRKCRFLHKGRSYLAYGLSEVVTRPDFQNRGLALAAIQRASRFIDSQMADVSIFTCARDKVSLYARGGWEPMENACLVGGTKELPFRSDSLGLMTVMRFISPMGKRHRADFSEGDIVLELGEGELW